MKIEKLLSEEELDRKIEELANILYKKYGDKKVVFVCILKGAIFFTCDLNIHFWKQSVKGFEINLNPKPVKL